MSFVEMSANQRNRTLQTSQKFYLLKQVYRVAALQHLSCQVAVLHIYQQWFRKATPTGNKCHMNTIQISKHIKISFYNFFFVATNSFYWCAIVQTVFVRQSLNMISTFTSFSVLNTLSFGGCIHRAFSSSPSVQSCEFTIRIIQVYRAGWAVWLDTDNCD